MTAVILRADARALPLPDASVDLIVTSPPYSDANAVEFLRPQVAHLKSRRYVWMPPGSFTPCLGTPAACGGARAVTVLTSPARLPK